MATITATDFAAQLDTDSKTARAFLRDNAEANGLPTPGKGSRWSIEARDVRSLKSRFTKWAKAQDEAKAAREAAKAEAPIADEAPIDEATA